MKNILFLFCCLIFSSTSVFSQDLTATEIIEKANQKAQGDYHQGEIKMSIIRPDWTREMTMKSWASGDDFSLILVTAPARDKGAAFLKRDKELWNWQTTIDRVIKMPPSMMSQSWMGSDFTNDDLVKQSSIVNDYDQAITGETVIEKRTCWEITLVPKEEAAVVWGKVKVWVDQKDFLQLKTEFYDEDDYLVNTMYGKKIGKLGGRTLPMVMEIIPAEEEGHKTRIEYLSMTFDKEIKSNFFTVQRMKRVR